MTPRPRRRRGIGRARSRRGALAALIALLTTINACGGTDVGSCPKQCTRPPPDVDSALFSVPDPRPGDLRETTDGDRLADDYVAPPPHSTTLDLRYGPDEAHRLDLFLPAEAPAPVVVFVHAGGWVSGERGQIPEIVRRFVERGYALASVDYRLAPEHVFPAAVEDVKRAIRWLKVRGQQDGTIDGDRLVVYGASAGGHVASLVATTPGEFEPDDLPVDLAQVDSTVAGVVSIVGPTDLTAFEASPHPWAAELTRAMLGCDPCDASLLRRASPITHVDDAVPPAYWGYGATDELVDPIAQGLEIATRWAATSGASESWFDYMEGCGHNVGVANINQRYVERFVDMAVA